ncbi:hypothetical protein ACFXTO_019146 [Malus domestica]
MPRSSMANIPKDMQGPVLTEIPTLYEKSRGKVTNEDLQATMMAIIKSMERNSVQTKEEVNRLCSLIRNLQRRLDLEYSTPENDHAKETMREASSMGKPVIPMFPLLEGKRKEESGTNQLVLEEIQKVKVPDPLLSSLNSRG